MNGTTTNLRDMQPNDDGKRKVPRWLPVSLLALTTVALTAPAVLLWRQKQALGPQTSLPFGRKQHISAPPARRRPMTGSGWAQTEANARPTASSSNASTSSAPPPRRASSRTNVISVGSAPTRKSVTSRTAQRPTPEASVSLFDGPLISLGALGLATGAVGVAAALGVWGVQRSLSVESVDEFAERIRQLLLSHMPALSRRIYRSTSEDDGGLPGGFTQQSATSKSHEGDEGEPARDEPGEWTWEAAEDRLRAAFDHGGMGEWAECAMRELEAEGRVERRRRGL